VALCFTLSHDLGGQDVVSEVRVEVARYIATINGGDPGAVAALYLHDPATGSLGNGQAYRGWETVADLLIGVYDAVGSIHMTVVTVLPLGEDAAVAFFRRRSRV
jgi:hypothetical protein